MAASIASFGTRMPDISKRLEKAEKYLQKGKMKDALEEFMAAVEEDPENNAVRERASDLCISLNQNKEAANLLGVLFDRLSNASDQAKAIVTYKKLARMATPRVEQTFRYAQYIEKSNKKEALELLQRSAEGFVAAGKKEDALEAYKRLVVLDGTLENLKAEGELAASLGQGKTAASAFFQTGELERAANRDGHSWFERAYKLDSGNLEVALAYAQSLLGRGDGAAALRVSQPLAAQPECGDKATEVYARSLLALKRPAEAEPIIWQLYEKDVKRVTEVAQLIGTLIDVEEYARALELAKKVGDLEGRQGRQRDFVSALKEVIDQHPPGTEFLEYMVSMFNATNREHDYCDALTKLFELYYAQGNF